MLLAIGNTLTMPSIQIPKGSILKGTISTCNYSKAELLYYSSQNPLAHPLYLTLSSSSSASGVITCLRRQFTTKYFRRLTSTRLAQGWYNITTAPCWNHKKAANFYFIFFSSHVKLKAKVSPHKLSTTPQRHEGHRYSPVYEYYYSCYQMAVSGSFTSPDTLPSFKSP